MGSSRAPSPTRGLWRPSLARTSAAPPAAPLALPVDDDQDVATVLATDLTAGLSADAVAARRARVGPNTLRASGPPPLLKIVFQLSLLSVEY